MNSARSYMKKNHGNELPGSVAFIEVYTEQEQDEQGRTIKTAPHVFKHACVHARRRNANGFYGNDTVFFASTESLWQYIRSRTRKNNPVWLFCYNGHFVMQAVQLWQEFDEQRFVLRLAGRKTVGDDGKEKKIRDWNGFVAIDDGPFVVYAIGGGGTVKVVDVKNYFDMPLADIAGGFGCVIGERPATASDVQSIRQWLKLRVDVLAECMCGLINQWGTEQHGNWQPTAARLAYSNYRHEFMGDFKILNRDSRIDRTFEREAFIGGEIQHFYKGEYREKVYKVDVTSLYPSVMQTMLCPKSIRTVAKLNTPLGSIQPIYPEKAIARCNVYGCADLPLRDKENRVSYPQGNFDTVLCGEELNWAVNNKRVRQYYEWVEYECDYLFGRYVTYWWSIRKQAMAMQNTAMAQMAKMMMNCLYGYLGRRASKWIRVAGEGRMPQWGYVLMTDPVTGKPRKYRNVAGVTETVNGQVEKNDSMVSASAFITSASRLFMRNVRELLPERSVLLQYVDMLLLTQKGYDELRNTFYWGPGELGRFRLVGEYSKVHIYSGNCYTADGKTVCAGLAEEREETSKGRYTTTQSNKTASVISNGPTREVGVNCKQFVIGYGKTVREFGRDGWAYA